MSKKPDAHPMSHLVPVGVILAPCTTCAAPPNASKASGTSSVATEAYRDGWERLFGATRDRSVN